MSATLQQTWLHPARLRPWAFTVVPFLMAALLVDCADDNNAKGLASLRLGDYAMAMDFFSAELKKNPSSYDARLGLGKALLQKAVAFDNDTVCWRQALVNLDAARTIRPGDEVLPLIGEAWSAYSRVLLMRSDTIQALKALSRAIGFTPQDPGPVNTAGILYFKMGYTDKAEILFSQALTIDSTISSTHFNLGMLAWQRGDVQTAHQRLLTALNHAPQDQDILYWFAVCEKTLREAAAP
jgi:tetratricopeptide (TPR) repeat protein